MIESLLSAYLLAQPPATGWRFCPESGIYQITPCYSEVLAPIVIAQQPDLDVLRARVDALEKRVKELDHSLTLCESAARRESFDKGYRPLEPLDVSRCWKLEVAWEACDRATALTVRIVRDNTALLTGGRAMGESERKAVERELEKASKACKESGTWEKQK